MLIRRTLSDSATYGCGEGERARENAREHTDKTDRQTDRQTDKQTNKQTGIENQAEKQMDGETRGEGEKKEKKEQRQWLFDDAFSGSLASPRLDDFQPPPTPPPPFRWPLSRIRSLRCWRQSRLSVLLLGKLFATLGSSTIESAGGRGGDVGPDGSSSSSSSVKKK